MNNSNFCASCGRPVAPGQNFCNGCGAAINVSVATPKPKVKRKTYTAQKFVSMGFAIGTIIFAISFFFCGFAFSAMAEEYADQARKYLIRDQWNYNYFRGQHNEYSLMADAYETAAGIMYGLAIILVLASVLCWVLFGVFSAKRKKVYAEIALEKQNEENARRQEEMLRTRYNPAMTDSNAQIYNGPNGWGGGNPNTNGSN